MESSKLRGIGLLVGFMLGVDLFSALMSSPWAAEQWGGTDERASAARKYIGAAVAFSLAAGVTAAWLTDNAWPAVGAAGGSAVMWWTYDHALQKAAA